MWVEDICNLITWPWPHKLLTLPFVVRLGLCVLCFPLCIIIYLLTFPPLHNGSILIIPMGLASWTFSKRGACSCFAAYIVVQVAYNAILFRGMLWPLDITFSFLGVVLILFLTGSTVVSLRHLLDSAEAMRLKAEEGERQTTVAYEQQRQLNQIKNQFILNVNHELRTPLAAAYGYLEMLQILVEQDEPLDRATHMELLKQALSSCSELCSLVNSTLDTLEVGSDTQSLKLEELAVATVVQDVLERSEVFQRQSHRIRLDIPANITIWTNLQCLRQILHNLLSNAFKYSPQDTPVVISACEGIDSGGQLCICVQDAGPGIPQDEISLLFGQFVRLKRDIGGAVRGSGLGLYISKRLVEVMGGRIWVESAGIAGLGSRFCFTLPCTSEQLLHSIASTDTSS